MDANDIAALPEARAYADWLNQQAQARDAVIAAARLVQAESRISTVGTFWEIQEHLTPALAALDALTPPAEPDETRPSQPTAELMRRDMQHRANGWHE